MTSYARLFFAITLPDAIKAQITDVIQDLQSQLPPQTIRWTKPDNLHITLHFLPAVNSDDIKKLAELVQRSLTPLPPCRIEFEKLELFPSSKQPRILSLAIKPNPILTTFAQHIGQGILAANYAIESRPFRPHLTLGRIQPPTYMDIPARIWEKIPAFTLTEIVFFESKRGPDGSNYTPLHILPL